MREGWIFHDKLINLMSETSKSTPIFTGLILLTGDDAPGIAQGLFQTLSEFTILVVDVEQVVISSRLILTVLITLNPVHQGAIEDDLAKYAQESNTDIATVFSNQLLVPIKNNRIAIEVTSEKMHPKTLASITQAIQKLDANIESIVRTENASIGLLLVISGTSIEETRALLDSLDIDGAAVVRVSAL
jgi:phosphoserine phosphatase